MAENPNLSAWVEHLSLVENYFTFLPPVGSRIIMRNVWVSCCAELPSWKYRRNLNTSLKVKRGQVPTAATVPSKQEREGSSGWGFCGAAGSQYWPPAFDSPFLKRCLSADDLSGHVGAESPLPANKGH